MEIFIDIKQKDPEIWVANYDFREIFDVRNFKDHLKYQKSKALSYFE